MEEKKEDHNMKKTYSKPQLVFDSFEVAENIAACASDARATQGECVVYIGGMPVFTTQVTGCRFKATDGAYGICYYVPSADNALFGS